MKHNNDLIGLDKDKRFQDEWYNLYVKDKWYSLISYYRNILFEYIKPKICETHEKLDKEEQYVWHGYTFLDSITNKETTFSGMFKKYKDYAYDIGDFDYDENGNLIEPTGSNLEKYLFDKVINRAIENDWMEDIRQTIWKKVMNKKDEILKRPKRKPNLKYDDLLNLTKKETNKINDLLVYLSNDKIGYDLYENLLNNIFSFFIKNGISLNDHKITIIENISTCFYNCKKLVKLSKTFIEHINTYSNKISKCYKELSKLNNEHGIVFFKDQNTNTNINTYIVYKIYDKQLNMWIFNEYSLVPFFYIEIDLSNICILNSIDLVDIKHDENYLNYINNCRDFLLGYLYLREHTDVEFKEVTELISSNNKSNSKINNKLTYFVFDSKWYTEICNDNEIPVCGHYRHQNYADGSRKPIWINSFTRHGYHRKASIDKYKDGELVLD